MWHMFPWQHYLWHMINHPIDSILIWIAAIFLSFTIACVSESFSRLLFLLFFLFLSFLVFMIGPNTKTNSCCRTECYTTIFLVYDKVNKDVCSWENDAYIPPSQGLFFLLHLLHQDYELPGSFQSHHHHIRPTTCSNVISAHTYMDQCKALYTSNSSFKSSWPTGSPWLLTMEIHSSVLRSLNTAYNEMREPPITPGFSGSSLTTSTWRYTAPAGTVLLLDVSCNHSCISHQHHYHYCHTISMCGSTQARVLQLNEYDACHCDQYNIQQRSWILYRCHHVSAYAHLCIVIALYLHIQYLPDHEETLTNAQIC